MEMITNIFSIGVVLKPMHVTIVKGFHKYTRAAMSPEGRISENKEREPMNHQIAWGK